MNYILRLKESILHLIDTLGRNRNELPYDAIKEEVFRRLNTEGLILDSKRSRFHDIFEKAHLKAEKSVQFLNKDVVNCIKEFKQGGGKVYLMSDFYCPKSLFQELIYYHGLSDIFDDVFSSSTLEKSKHTGTAYPELIRLLGISNPSEVLMIGDNEHSDSVNAEKAGLNSFVLPHKKYLRRNKWNAIGNDSNQLKGIFDFVRKECNKEHNLPFTEYILFYHFFTERLYNYCKKNDVNSLFFLSREGLFLKRLFDNYQSFQSLTDSNDIKTHYLKVSRQASLQIALLPIDDEPFNYLKKKYKLLSVNELLNFFNFNSNLQSSITKDLDFDCDALHEQFFDSQYFKKLRDNKSFREGYEAHRLLNKSTFNEYIKSFGEPVEDKGIHVVDIGWGGTMQEAIYNFFEGKIKVYGYYLGLNLIYNPNKDTKRKGLIFSILPYKTYDFHILHANTQLYEQFAGANHGCCVAYKKSDNGFTVEYHEENEKWLYDNYIGNHQEQMFALHNMLLKQLQPICYSDNELSKKLVAFALRLGTLQSVKKLNFLETLNSGYYQNISTKKTGIDYEIPKGLISVKEFSKFIFKPEDYFRYIVKLKYKLYKSNKVIAAIFPNAIDFMVLSVESLSSICTITKAFFTKIQFL